METDCNFRDAQKAQVPPWVIQTMKARRLESLREIRGVLKRLLKLYEETQCRWTDDCDAIALGKLIRGLKAARLYPLPKVLELTRSISDLLTTLRSVKLPEECDKYRKGSKKRYVYDEVDEPEPVHMSEDLQQSLTSIENRIEGLNLDRMVPKKCS